MSKLLHDLLKKNGMTPVEQQNDGGGDGNEQQQNNGGAGGGAADTDDLPEEQLLLALEKKGIKVTNLEELKPKPAAEVQKTPEQLAQEKRERTNKARAFGLEQNLVTADLLDEYANTAQMTDEQIARAVYVTEQLQEDSTLPENERRTQADIELEFDETYHRADNETSRRKKTADKHLTSIANAYRKAKYAKVLDLEDAYDNHVSTAAARTGYNQVVNEAAAAIPEKLPVEFKDGKGVVHKYTYTVPSTTIQKVKETYGNDVSFAALGKGATKETLLNAMTSFIKQTDLDAILLEIAESIASKQTFEAGKGRRAIPSENGGNKLVVEDANGTRQSGLAALASKPENRKFIKKI